MSQEANYSYTLKTPKAGNLFTIRGDTAAEAKANLDAAVESGLLAAIASIEASLNGQPAPASTVSPAASAAAQPAQELPAGFAVRCDTCGGETRFEQEGISKKSGTPYRRYSCTTSNLHKATFTS